MKIYRLAICLTYSAVASDNSSMTTAWDTVQSFLTLSYPEQRAFLLGKTAEELEEIGFQKALQTFKRASVQVPAYRDFLQKHGVDPEKIHTKEDFAALPIVNKKNYLRQYPLHDLCWEGSVTSMNVISVSSGSTGKPFLWPRDIWLEREVDYWYSLTLEDLFNVPEKPSLLLICFAMGMYIAGPFTYASCLRYSQTGRPLTVACPGNRPDEVLQIIRDLWPEYEQIIIGGYPPLVKDIIDIGIEEGIDWKAKTTKLFFGGEGFSEHWRDYVHAKTGHPQRTGGTVNMYGTADAALLGIETPTSVLLRSLAEGTDARLAFFKDERLPSVLAYNPLFKYFEITQEDTVIFTSSTGVPLIRYDIGDQGGLISYRHAAHLIQDSSGQSLQEKLEQEHFSHLDLAFPLVYVFGRKDFTVHLYGANVYPENIKESLEDPLLVSILTGKFIMTVEHTADMTPYLQVRVQCQPDINRTAGLRDQIASKITRTLRQRNSEYDVIYNTIHEKAEPRVILDSYSNQDYTVNIKHRWVR